MSKDPNLGIAALEDGLFQNLLIFNYLWEKGKEKERKKGREKGREKGKEKGKGKREGKREGGITCIAVRGGGGGADPATKL